jgi:N-methylhydantoinase B
MRHKDGTLKLFNTGKVNMRLNEGESYVLYSGGGGGFGVPKKRDRHAVLRDLRLGYISEAAARDTYGVTLTAKERQALAHSLPSA